jgi:hypothetical protein
VAQSKENAVTAIAKALLSSVSTESPDADVFKTIVLFCGLGLLASLLLTAGLVYLQIDPPQASNVMDWI